MDHAWGSHTIVMGDGVRGGNFYGQFPSIVIGGPNDVDTGAGTRGRMLPTTSVDQYAATLASWFGLDDAAVQAAIPNCFALFARKLRLDGLSGKKRRNGKLVQRAVSERAGGTDNETCRV